MDELSDITVGVLPVNLTGSLKCSTSVNKPEILLLLMASKDSSLGGVVSGITLVGKTEDTGVILFPAMSVTAY